MALRGVVGATVAAVELIPSSDPFTQSHPPSFPSPISHLLRFCTPHSLQMLSQWRYVVVGATVAAAVLTPSTDPFTQSLLAIPLIGLYMGGATAVKFIEKNRDTQAA